MDLSPKTTVTTLVDDKAWLGSKHGLDATRTITLDIAGGTFDDLIVSDGSGYGMIPSGTAVAAVDETGELYELATAYDENPDTDTDGGGADTDTDGPEVLAKCDGHLVESVRVHLGVAGPESETAAGALLWHGVVIAALVPNETFEGATDGAPHILYL